MIVFDFFDDRMDILSKIHQFFILHPSLLPSNINLRLFNYKGEKLSVLLPLKEKISSPC